MIINGERQEFCVNLSEEIIMSKSEVESGKKLEEKKPYSSPELVACGSLLQLTQTSDNPGADSN